MLIKITANKSDRAIIYEIIIIDNYFSKDLLDILRKLEKKIIIVSKNFDNELIKKYNSQYENIVFLNNNSFHDRLIIIDRKIVYYVEHHLKI